jgi:protein SCO1/2
MTILPIRFPVHLLLSKNVIHSWRTIRETGAPRVFNVNRIPGNRHRLRAWDRGRKSGHCARRKLGQYLPADAEFADENGRRVLLRNLIDRPTIIAPVYLGCMHECPMLLSGLAQVLGKIELVKPGTDYQVITLSFDENDTPAIAQDKKVNYIKAVGKPFPEAAWKFLTGDKANIRKFTDSIGFKFQRDSEHDFSHPVTLVVIAPGGKIVRYLEGFTFLPFEVTMALTEAAEGRVGSPARSALMYCFSYDPLKKSYVFNVLKVTGTVMVLFVASFFAYLMISTKKKRGSA